MQMTIGKKLISSFLGLGLLVGIAGIGGIFILEKVSRSADLVCKGKLPAQYAVMQSVLALEKAQAVLQKYVHATSDLQEMETLITRHLDEFGMWSTMLRLGTESPEFKESPAGQLYAAQKLSIIIPKLSGSQTQAVVDIEAQGLAFRDNSKELFLAQRQYSRYAVHVQGGVYTLPAFLDMAELYHLDWIRQLKDAVNIETTFTGETDPAKGLVGEWLGTFQVDNKDLQEKMEKMTRQYAKLMDLANDINKAPKYTDKLSILQRGIGVTSKLEKYFLEMHGIGDSIYSQLEGKKQAKLAEINSSAEAINLALYGLATEVEKEMNLALREADDVKKSGSIFLVVLTLGSVVIAILLGFFITRGITRPINDIIASLIEGAQQVNGSAGQVSSSSQSLAGGVSEQAAALEQSSASIEEMAAMTSRNAENAYQAESIMKDSQTIVSQAGFSMHAMRDSMEEISQASQETSKIVKTIDEIAFQTNLLALNAAVEAARAGEAGAGFAVVADEVRNLALRAAEAARETSRLIEGTVQKVTKGKNIVHETNTAFAEVASSSDKIAALIDEIAVSSKEQAQGASQINIALSQMDTVTQNNAASAEESAAASEELNAQAISLMEHVKVLQGLVNGNREQLQIEKDEWQRPRIA